MKKLTIVLSIIVAATVVIVGCGKKGPDTSKVEQSFAAAEPSAKEAAQKAVDAANAGKYPEAMAALQQLGAKAKLTPEQQTAVKDLLTQISEQLKEQAAKAAEQAKEGAAKAMDDLKKSFGK